jgi:hypothetical protein
MPVVLCLTACAPGYDLQLSATEPSLAVGDQAVVKVQGTLDMPRNSSAWISVGFTAEDERDDWTDALAFEPIRANPSGIAQFLYPTDDNVAPAVLFDAIDDRPEEVIATWQVTCYQPGTYTLWPITTFTTASGAPVSPAAANNNEVTITCE